MKLCSVVAPAILFLLTCQAGMSDVEHTGDPPEQVESTQEEDFESLLSQLEADSIEIRHSAIALLIRHARVWTEMQLEKFQVLVDSGPKEAREAAFSTLRRVRVVRALGERALACLPGLDATLCETPEKGRGKVIRDAIRMWELQELGSLDLEKISRVASKLVWSDEVIPLIEAVERALAQPCRHPSSAVRASACLSIRLVGDRSSEDVLLALVKDQDEPVRVEALRALASTGSPSTWPFVTALLKDQSPVVQANALVCLARTGNNEQARDWSQQLRNGTSPARREILFSLLESDTLGPSGDGAEEMLLAALSCDLDEDPRVRTASASVSLVLSKNRRRSTYEELLSRIDTCWRSGHSRVVRLALDTLARVENPKLFSELARPVAVDLPVFTKGDFRLLLKQRCGITLQEDAHFSMRARIGTGNVVSVREVLDRALEDADLWWILKGNVMVLTTVEKAILYWRERHF